MNGNPTLLVTGANGFLGSHICRIANESGVQVIGITRSTIPTDLPASIQWAIADVLESDDWQTHLQNCFAVIHCIGTLEQNSATQTTHKRVIYQSAQRVGQAAHDAGVKKFVFISASGAPPGTPKTYLQSKRRAEQFLTTLGMNLVILRPSAIYGAERPESLKRKALMERLRRLPFIGWRMRDNKPLAVELVARAAVRAAIDDSITGLLKADEIERLGAPER